MFAIPENENDGGRRGAAWEQAAPFVLTHSPLFGFLHLFNFQFQFANECFVHTVFLETVIPRLPVGHNPAMD